MSAQDTALVLIEFQNDFTTPGGILHEAVRPMMESSNMLAHTVETVAAARKAGVLIVWSPIQFAEGYSELNQAPYGILKSVKESGSFVKGSWGAAMVDALTPQPGDIVIEGKRGLDAFATTNLDFVLRQHRIRTVALGGFLTNCCVESTMRSAYEKGFDVVTLTDCTATFTDEEQRVAVEKTYPMFSRPMTHTEFVGTLAA